MKPQPANSSSLGFGPSVIIEPRSGHTHTAIVLTRRGTHAGEFVKDFLNSTLSDDLSLCEKFPSWRWVFPCPKDLWSTAFQQYYPSWFEAHSLTDPTARQDLQVEGLRESIHHIWGILEEEEKRFPEGSGRGKLILGGISQGGATAMWTLLSRPDTAAALGGAFLASTWLPFADELERHLSSHTVGETAEPDSNLEGVSPWELMRKLIVSPISQISRQSSPQLRIHMGHGTDDAWVNIQLGLRAAQVLRLGGWDVDWREYHGAKYEGHWFKVPEEMDDIHRFLEGLHCHASE